MPLLTKDIQKVLDAETDARFSIQTGYKPGQKLDPKKPADAAFIPVWLDIYKKVKAEWEAGKLVKTYNHPVVAGAISDAHTLLDAASNSIAAALGTTSVGDNLIHAADAQAAHAQANAVTANAAQYQPPTVDTRKVAQAASQVAAHLMASGNPQAVAVAQGLGRATAVGPAVNPATIATSSAPMTTRDAVDTLQASMAPAKAQEVHDVAATTPPPLDAPKPEAHDRTSTGKTLITLGVIGGLVTVALLIPAPEPDFYRRYRMQLSDLRRRAELDPERYR
jgi:hypothetical protein